MISRTYLHKKRIVFTALHPYFNGKDLMRAMVLWDQNYSNEPSFAIQYFLKDLKESINDQADYRGIQANFLKTAHLPEEALLNDPSPLIEDYLKAYNLEMYGEPNSPELKVFIALIDEWQNKISLDHHRKVTQYILEHIGTQNIQRRLGIQFSAWLMNQRETLKIPDVNVSDLRKMILLYYTACCEYLGPEKTQHIFLKEVLPALSHHDKSAIHHLLDVFLQEISQ